jgi:hypothetical protein
MKVVRRIIFFMKFTVGFVHYSVESLEDVHIIIVVVVVVAAAIIIMAL